MRRSGKARALAPESDDESQALTLDPEFNRRRTGLNQDEIKGLVRAVRRGAAWEEAVAGLAGDVQPGVLEGWRDEILRRAASAGSPVLPAKSSNGASEREAPPALAKLYADREDRVQALADAQREAAEFRAAVADAEGALKLAAARSVVKRGTPKAKREVAQARKVMQNAIAGEADAAVRAEAAAVAVAEIEEELARTQEAHGAERQRRLSERLGAWARAHEEEVLDGVAAILALRKARIGLSAALETGLIAHFGVRVSAGAMATRVAAVEERFLSDTEPAEDNQKAARPGGRRRGAEAAC